MSEARMLYGALGPMMINDVYYSDGSSAKGILGGSLFALEGFKLWTDDCFMVGRRARDFEQQFGEWFDQNHLTRRALTPIDCDHGIYSSVEYRPDGSYLERSLWEDPKFSFSNPDYSPGYRDLAAWAGEARGFYFNLDGEPEVFKRIHLLKKDNPFICMWEIKTRECRPDFLPVAMELMGYVEMFSINLPEAMSLFSLESEEECVEAAKALPVEFTLLRAGEKGLWAVTPGRAEFIPIRRYHGPVQDPTGCGNSSTAAALWAWAEGYDSVMTGLIANTTAYYNVMQFGPIARFDPAVREKELALLQLEREQYDPTKICRATGKGGKHE